MNRIIKKSALFALAAVFCAGFAGACSYEEKTYVDNDKHHPPVHVKPEPGKPHPGKPMPPKAQAHRKDSPKDIRHDKDRDDHRR